METAPQNEEGFFETEQSGSQEALQSVLGLLRIAQYRQNTILWVLSATLLCGAAYYTVATRFYRSSAKLMVIEQSGDEFSKMGEQAGADNLMATQKELVRSPVVVRRAIDSLPPEHRIDLLEVAPHRWVKDITSRLSSSTTRKTNFVSVGYESRDPEAAAGVVRAIIDAYLSFVEETHRGTAADVLDVLTTERDQLASDLENKQLVLQQSRERVGHLSLPDREDVVDPIIARAIRINDSLLEAQQVRLDLQASMITLQGAVARGEDLRQHIALIQETVGEKVMLSAMGMADSDMAVLAEQQTALLTIESELAKMAPFYAAEHPTIKSLEQQASVKRKYLAEYHNFDSQPNSSDNQQLGPMLTGMLQQALDQAYERERQLENSFQIARSEASRQSGQLVGLEMLQREVNRLEKLHDVLFDKIATVDIHQVQAPIRATIVEEPLPNLEASSPKLRMILVGSILGGLLLGFGMAYVQDLLDDRFGSPEEITIQLGVRVLALVRQLQALPGKGLETVQMVANPQAVDSEAFRTLRTSIALSTEVSERLVISSSEPSDGKTTISANLAASYALSGKRTLVIDADLRKPGMTALLDLKGHAGVTDVLSAKENIGAVAESCLFHTTLENLDVIPAGPRRPDPAELLLGPNFAELLAWADAHYDQVLVDCPPTLAVSDAQIIGRLVDGVVLVVTPEKNHRRLVARACQNFQSAGIPLLGIVANRITQQSHGYGYGYGYGYGHDEAETELAIESQSNDPAENGPRVAA